jgi:hypothetical protein
LEVAGLSRILLGMSLRNADNGALIQNNTIVFSEFVHSLAKGLVSTEVGDYAL